LSLSVQHGIVGGAKPCSFLIFCGHVLSLSVQHGIVRYAKPCSSWFYECILSVGFLLAIVRKTTLFYFFCFVLMGYGVKCCFLSFANRES